LRDAKLLIQNFAFKNMCTYIVKLY